MTTPPSSSRPSARPSGGSTSGRSFRLGPLAITIIVMVVLVAFVAIAAQLWTEVLWYRQIGYTEVLWTEWGTRAILAVGSFLIAGAMAFGMILIAYRSRKLYPPTTQEERNLDSYRSQIEPYKKLITIAAAVIIGLIVAVRMQGAWREILLWFNGQPFGETDPQFGLDISFFAFTMPALRLILTNLMVLVVAMAVAAIAVHYLYGGISLAPRTSNRISKNARIQVGILAAVFVILVGLGYWLDRYALLLGNHERFAGASYADINASLPTQGIMALIAGVVAIMFIISAFRGTWKLPVAGIAMMVVSALVIGTAYPALIQRFEVDPNAVEAEGPYIDRNIEATHEAYGLADVEIEAFNPTTDVEAGQLVEDAGSTGQLRLLDPTVVSPTFDQLEQIRQYYQFPDQLAVDRYDLGGEQLQDTVIGVREINLDGLDEEQLDWVNTHTVYSHGYGVVAAYGNQTDADGLPTFFESGIPSVGEIGDYEPRVYFGQETDHYSVVGAPDDMGPWELDYPDDTAPDGMALTTYQGDGGPDIGNFFNQLLFAVRMGDIQILLSDRVNDESQILFDRDPHTRVAKVAPYLTLDSMAYPAVVDDDDDPDTPSRLVWIIDGYTTSNEYPYSARASLEDATTDALTVQETPETIGQEPEQVNYIRNSVKAVVDAYDGSVTLYAWDEMHDEEDRDPVLETWRSIFPDAITPLEEMSGDMMAHMRYPGDYFRVQRELLRQYHVTDSATFYAGSDFWNIPPDPTTEGGGTVPQPPFYLTLRMPEQEEATFSQSTAYIPGGQDPRNVLTGFLAVDSETGSEPGEVRDGYGTLRMLELPRTTTVPGPGQVQNNFNSDVTVSTELNLLRQGGTAVESGNLLTIPVGDGLLYVQPVYVRSTGETSYPSMQRVLVAFGDTIGFAPTLTEALDEVFGGDAGAEAGDADLAEETPDDEDADPDAPEAEGDVEVPAAAQDRLTEALDLAVEALLDGEEALAEGDWSAYGDAQQRLDDALEDAIAAENEIAEATGEAPIEVPDEEVETPEDVEGELPDEPLPDEELPDEELPDEG